MASGLPDDARCLHCGYALRGLPGNICPECGRGFNPADPSTYRMPRLSIKWRRWAAPPSWHHAAGAAYVACTFTLAASLPARFLGLYFWSADVPFTPLIGGCCSVLVLPLLLVVDYVGRLILIALARRDAPTDGAAASERGNWRWWVLPLAAAICAATFGTGWPMRARFTASQVALENEVRRLLATPPAASTPAGWPILVDCEKWIGWYHVWSARLQPEDQTVEFITGGSSITWWGFVYDPQGRHYSARRSVAPGWYEYVYSK